MCLRISRYCISGNKPKHDVLRNSRHGAYNNKVNDPTCSTAFGSRGAMRREKVNELF